MRAFHRFLAIAALSFTLTPAATGAQEVVKPSFGDNAPVSWTGKSPSKYAVHGIDAARFQESINWKQARKAGVNFAFLKATEGGDLLDPMFESHWNGAKKAGVLRGAYHFYYFCTEPEVQARWFIKNVKKRKGTLPPVLDMEWNPFSPTCTKRPPAKEVRRQMTIWLDMVERHFGQRPIIYTTPQFYKDAGLSAMKNEEFWLRSTAKTLDKVYPGQAWVFWQYSATGVISGIEGEVDLNAFAGSPKAWRQWVKKRSR